MIDSHRERAWENLFTGFVATALLVFLIVAGLYFYRFAPSSHGFSQNPADWAEFGEYIGGTLGGIFGLFAFIGLLITIVRQRVDSERQVQATLDAVVRAHSVDTQSRRESILAIAEAANEVVRQIGEVFLKPEYVIAVDLNRVYDQTVIDGLVGALSSAPLHEIGSRDAVIALLSLRDQIRLLGKAIALYEKPGTEPISEYLPQIETLAKSLDSQRSRLIQNVIDRVGAIQRTYESLNRAITETTRKTAA